MDCAVGQSVGVLKNCRGLKAKVVNPMKKEIFYQKLHIGDEVKGHSTQVVCLHCTKAAIATQYIRN